MIAALNAAYFMEEVLPVHTTVHQLDDGTLFYFKSSEPHRLHIKWLGQDVDAELPKGKIVHLFAFHNAIYFTMQSDHVFKASSHLNRITVSFVRTLQAFESVDALGLCKKMEFGYYDYVYRLCDNEIPDGVPIDAEMANFQRARIHRGKLYYVRENQYKLSEMTLMGSSIVGFDIPSFDLSRSWASYAREDSPFMHFSFQHHLHTINVETREVFPMLVFGDVFNLQIISVIDNIATLTGQAEGQTHLITAEFPPGYFNKGFPITVNEIPTAVADENNFLAPKYKAADHNAKKMDFRGMFNLQIISVIDNIATLTGQYEGETHLITAQFSEGYFDKGRLINVYEAPYVPVNERVPTIYKAARKYKTARKSEEAIIPKEEPQLSLLDQRIKEMEQAFQSKEQSQKVQDDHAKYLDKKLNELQFQVPEEETDDAMKRRQYEEDMSETLNQLIDQNFELTQQLEQLKQANEKKDESAAEELARLCERNEELTEINKRLEADNWEISQELERIETENEELEAANMELIKETEELTKRKEQKEKEMQSTIDELDAKNAEIAEDIKNMELTNACADSSTEEENAELERRIAMITEMNVKLAKALAEITDSSRDDYEIIDNISE